jgi:hypothetical protein
MIRRGEFQMILDSVDHFDVQSLGGRRNLRDRGGFNGAVNDDEGAGRGGRQHSLGPECDGFKLRASSNTQIAMTSAWRPIARGESAMVAPARANSSSGSRRTS